MRIAYVTDTYLPEINGAVTAIDSHTRELAARGHEVLIVSPAYPAFTDEPAPGITIARYPAVSFITNRATRVALPSIVSLAQKLRRFAPDIVHIHTPLSLGVLGLAVTRMLGLPNVQTYHTYIPDFMQYLEPSRILGMADLQQRITDSYVFVRMIDSGLWQRIVRGRAFLEGVTEELFDEILGISSEVAEEEHTELSTRVAWRFTRMLYNRADLVLTPSTTLKRELMHHGVTVPVDYLSNGLDLSLVRPKEEWEPRGRVLHAGRLGYEKNVDVVVQAFARSAEKLPGLELHIAGDGPARETLERLAERLGVGERVRFLGFMDREALAGAYRDYDVFLTASTIETQGIVLLEAMAAGLPVLGVRALAIPEIVRNGRDGAIVPAYDVQAMAEKLVELASDSERRERLGRQCIADVRAHDLPVVVDALEDVYRQAIARHAAR